MDLEIKLLLAAVLGASIQEVFYWYEIRTKLELKKNKAIMKSTAYWIVTIMMVFFSAIGVYFFLESNIDRYIARDFMVYGFSFPLILKKATKVIAINNIETKLGSDYSIKNTFKSYFDI